MTLAFDYTKIKLADNEQLDSTLKYLTATITTLEKMLREAKQARTGVEIASIATQVVSGLITTEEALAALGGKIASIERLHVGDIDLLTGLSVESQHVERQGNIGVHTLRNPSGYGFCPGYEKEHEMTPAERRSRRIELRSNAD